MRVHIRKLDLGFCANQSCCVGVLRFHSVSLNVNNPHFLIMQGRITKVINMKPQETLSMIEEAAGTRMYENKKAVALKTLEKKQNKARTKGCRASGGSRPPLQGFPWLGGPHDQTWFEPLMLIASSQKHMITLGCLSLCPH